MRLVSTGGIIGIAVVLGAVLVGQDVAGWIVGLVVGLTSVILAALLWSSRQLKRSLDGVQEAVVRCQAFLVQL